MSEQKNMLIAITLSFLILFGFHFFVDSKNVKEIEKSKSETSLFINQYPISSKKENSKIVEEEDFPNMHISIKTERLSGSINLKGARFDDLKLLEYKETLDPNSGPVVLLDKTKKESEYYAFASWANIEAGEDDVPTSETLWYLVGNSKDVLSSKHPIKLEWKNRNGVIFERVISIDDKYMISITDSVINKSSKNLKILPRNEIVRAYPKEDNATSAHEGGIAYLKNSEKEITFGKIKKKNSLEGSTKVGWAGFTDKYWLTSFIINDSEESCVIFKEEDDLAKCIINSAPLFIKSGERVEYKRLLFAGAKSLKYLEGYERSHGVKRFDLTIDFGWFYFLTKPLFYLMQFLNYWIGNLAIVIIVLTILSKIVTFPFARTSFRSMARMKDIQPKMDLLKKRYGEDKVKLNEEMMKLYKTEKVNPASGCLPLLIQMPIFFCLYKVFSISLEMRHAPFIWWIKDLSAPDPTSLFNLFGLIPWDPPSFLCIGALPLLMGATMFLQQKLSPQPSDPTQAKMMYIMPLVFLFMFSSFSSGLVLYWTASNVFSIVQQFFIQDSKPSKKTDNKNKG